MTAPTLASIADHWAFLLVVWISGLVVGGAAVGFLRDRPSRQAGSASIERKRAQ